MGSRSSGGEEAMDISLVDDIEGSEKGPPDTWPESLELGPEPDLVKVSSPVSAS